MLTLARLDELAAARDPKETSAALREYVESLPGHDKRNLIAMAELKPALELVKMAGDAPEESEAVFVRVAAIIRHASDSLGELTKAAEEMDIAAIMARLIEAAEAVPQPLASPAQTSEPLPSAPAPVAGVGIQNAEPYTELYELPVFSLVGDREVYDTVAKMQKGRSIKETVTGGWFVAGAKPSENHYTELPVAERMIERHLLIPALGLKANNPHKEYNLSAIAWRCMGCLYTDKTAEIELQVYSVLGTDRDNPTARRWRSVVADWRARQARKDTTPGWNRYAEFTTSLGDKVTGDGAHTVVVVFDSGADTSPDTFEFYGACLNEKGYLQYSRPKGAVGKTVSQMAFDLASAAALEYTKDKQRESRAEAARAKAAKSVKIAKPPAPVLSIIDDGDDAEALAAELGII